MSDHYLRFNSISKRFPGVLALDNVSFGVGEGSVHALLGENGAGKSTLLKILSGVYTPDRGTLTISGQDRVFRSASEALAGGVAVIYQELHLEREMTVAENLLLGHMPNRFGWIDKRRMRRTAAELLSMMGEEIEVSAKVGSLTIAQRQIVEIAKALSRNAKVIAFDEPTSSLSARETENLFRIIKQLKDQGRVILYVSHRLEEILRIADSATVLRDGQHVETFDDVSSVTTDLLVNRMVGRAISDIYDYRTRPIGEPVLKVDKVFGPGLSEPASLEVREGEIVGLFGLVGAGRTELLKLIYGATSATKGNVSVCGSRARVSAPPDAIRRGVVFCPEDRKSEGIIPIRSVAENINLNARRLHSRFGIFINESKDRQNALGQIKRLAIRVSSPRQLMANLSGGNQQKAILARWLSEDIKVIIMDEPTRGIDVGAKSEIYSILYKLSAGGAGILIASSELPEVLGISDRVLVMREGRLSGSLDRREATPEKVLSLALPQAAGSGRPDNGRSPKNDAV